MSKTASRVYAKGYRAGRRLTLCEKIAYTLKSRRRGVEEWISDYPENRSSFAAVAIPLLLIAAALAIAIACNP